LLPIAPCYSWLYTQHTADFTENSNDYNFDGAPHLIRQSLHKVNRQWATDDNNKFLLDKQDIN
jgi:hypothetical protein